MTVKIPLTQGYEAVIDAEDFERVSARRWHVMRRSGRGRYVFSRERTPGRKWRTVLLHRYLMNPPPEMTVHHKDGDGLNNSRENLQIIPHKDNTRSFCHPRRGKTSRFRGVSWASAPRCWRAVIRVDRRFIHIGLFAFEEDAARAYDKAAREFFGPIAQQNLP